VTLTLEDGRQLIDGMSSWWAAVHGYAVPELDAAVADQISRMSHVMFGGLTHRPAVELGERLAEVTPAALQRVFLCDSGSVAIEVAIKMALQYYRARGLTGRTRMLTVRGGYHGDTFGAMAVCDPVNGMHSEMFGGVLAHHIFAPRPTSTFGEGDAAPAVEADAAGLATLLEQHRGEVAAVILEPIVQGAGGMRMYSAAYLKRVRRLCDEHGVLLILDCIATGFGRTGKLFACEHAEVSPDIMCVGKALTGGYLTMGVTLATDEVAEGVSGGVGATSPVPLMHGPTFMANPLACAVANASLELLLASPWEARVAAIEARLEAALRPLAASAAVSDVRVLGGIGVLEMAQPLDTERVTKLLVERGVWLRPFGKLLYAMPPFVISERELAAVTDAMAAVVDAVEREAL
jgi:adenosylmethionine-8-amino-7-oxononanoate aminotransferase